MASYLAMDFYPQLSQDLEALVMAVTGLPSAQVITTQQAITRNLVALIARATKGPQNDPSVGPQMPMAVIGIGHFKSRTDRGIQNDAYDADLTIWYIAQEVDSAQANITMQSQVNAFAYSIGKKVRENMPNTPNNYSSFLQMDADGEIDSSEMEPLNMRLRNDEKISVISASITWGASLMVGEFAIPR